MNDTDRERILDNRVQARLRTDRAYLNAENGHEQSAREDEITDEEITRLDREVEARVRAEQMRSAAIVRGIASDTRQWFEGRSIVDGVEIDRVEQIEDDDNGAPGGTTDFDGRAVAFIFYTTAGREYRVLIEDVTLDEDER